MGTGMRWSISLGRVGGVQIYLHVTFVLTLLWAAWQGADEYGGVGGAFFGVGAVLSLFLCVLLHELGHSVWALAHGIQVRHIVLLPIGGLASLETLPRKPKDELLIALAGPAVNLGLALLLGGVLLLALAPSVGEPIGARLALALREPGWLGLLVYLTLANALLVAFNLLPAFPMDGGRVLRAALAMRLPYARATRGAALLGQFVAVGLIVLGLFGLRLSEAGIVSNLGLTLIGAVVFTGALQEERQVRLVNALHSLTVGDACRQPARTVSPGDVISPDMAETLFEARALTPVVAGRHRRLVGVLARGGALPEGERVASVMRVDYPVVRRQAPLWAALDALEQSPFGEALVVDRGRLYGVIAWSDIKQAARASESRRLAPKPHSAVAGD